MRLSNPGKLRNFQHLQPFHAKLSCMAAEPSPSYFKQDTCFGLRWKREFFKAPAKKFRNMLSDMAQLAGDPPGQSNSQLSGAFAWAIVTSQQSPIWSCW